MSAHWQWLLIALALGVSLWRLSRPLRRNGPGCHSEPAPPKSGSACGGCTGCEIGRRKH